LPLLLDDTFDIIVAHRTGTIGHQYNLALVFVFLGVLNDHLHGNDDRGDGSYKVRTSSLEILQLAHTITSVSLAGFDRLSKFPNIRHEDPTR
jgi:hypothetical protein